MELELDTSNKVETVLSVSRSDSSDEPTEKDARVISPCSTPDILRERIPSNYKKRRTIYTAGRPPWYTAEGEQKQAFVIGLAGGSASGKTTVARHIIESLGVPWVCLLSMDSFYKVLTPEQHHRAIMNEYNFDEPDAIDFELLVETLKKLKEGKSVQVPVYDFGTHARANYTNTMYGANVIIFEGIMSFINKKLLDLLDLKVFVDTDSDVRLARRLKRDITERARDLEGVLKQYNKFVKPAFLQYIEPSMQWADIVVPQGAENKVAMQLIVNHVKDRLKNHGSTFRSKLINDQPNGDKLPESVHIMPSKSQDKVVDTPQEGVQYKGKEFKGKVCGVAILRAGEVLEPAFLSVRKDATIGKILIQTNEKTREPELHFLRLPQNIAECHVILMDATIATGAAAMMAIRILLDHHVPQDHILLVSILAAQLGVHSVAYVYPEVKIVTSAMDPMVNDSYHIIPGVGNYGDRYFGTEPEDYQGTHKQ